MTDNQLNLITISCFQREKVWVLVTILTTSMDLVCIHVSPYLPGWPDREGSWLDW